jgi:hypothetical protein
LHGRGVHWAICPVISDEPCLERDRTLKGKLKSSRPADSRAFEPTQIEYVFETFSLGENESIA